MPRRPRTRAQAKRESREALIRAGSELFAKRGLYRPSLDSICARAGYTRGAFYVHFKDRDDFVAAVMERLLGKLIDTVIAAGEGGRDLAQLFQRFVEVVEFVRTLGTPTDATAARRGIRLHELIEACARLPAVRARVDSLVSEASERVAKLVGDGQQRGVVRPDADAEALGNVLVTLAVGTLVTADVGVAQRFNLDRSREVAFRLVAAKYVLPDD